MAVGRFATRHRGGVPENTTLRVNPERPSRCLPAIEVAVTTAVRLGLPDVDLLDLSA